MGLAAEMLAEVDALIAEYGVEIDYERTSAGFYNTATRRTTRPETPFKPRVIITGCTKELVQGVGVVAGDLLAVSSPTQFATAPQVTETVTRGERYSVVAVTSNEIQGEIVSYDMQYRRA